MNTKEVDTELYCDQCAKDSLHSVVFVNEIIYKIKCKTCGRVVANHDVPKEVYGSLIGRVMTKPKRMKQEIKHDIKQGELVKALRLPLRFVSKPFRLYHELEEIRNLEKKTDVLD